MEIDQITKLVKLLKKNGVTYFKSGDLELSLLPKGAITLSAPNPTPAPQEPINTITAPLFTDSMPSDEDMLYHSSGFDPEAADDAPADSTTNN